ncbi:MAG TPA: 50S ribosomal protein L19e [Candidatus Thermoplasmatota archaeon]|nr:50S ribosomal protein L19e [Candidatus Thermoplasmatota archaeon]
MTDLRNQRRMAALLLDCGASRIWIDPLHAEEVAAAVTRSDVRKLIARGWIEKLQETGVSRGRARALAIQKKSGRRKGEGSRKGAQGSKARSPRKTRWVRTIRPLRRVLAQLRDEGKISPRDYRAQYLRAKGGVYRSKNHLLSHLRTEGVLKEPPAGGA